MPTIPEDVQADPDLFLLFGMFRDHFDFSPHPATQKLWMHLMNVGQVQLRHNQFAQDDRVQREMEFAIELYMENSGEEIQTFSLPYKKMYILADKMPTVEVDDYDQSSEEEKDEDDDFVEHQEAIIGELEEKPWIG